MTGFRRGLALAGFAAAVWAVLAEHPLVTWFAIGLLSAALLLRIIQWIASRRAGDE